MTYYKINHMMRKGTDIMSKEYVGQAIGVFELDNLTACFVAADVAAKTADIKIQGIERNRLKWGACVKIRGGISDVTAAMEAALKAAEPIAKVVSHTIIASPTADTETAIAMTIKK